MALWPLHSVSPCMTYEHCSDPWPYTAPFGLTFNHNLCEPPREYAVTLSETYSGARYGNSFFYLPRLDRYLLFHVSHARWINWEMGRWSFNGEGVEDKTYRGGVSLFFYGTLKFQRRSNVEVGSYGKVYGVDHWIKQMGEVSASNLSIVTDGWHLNYRQIPGMPAGVVSGLVYITHCIVNREDGYLVLRVANENRLRVWKWTGGGVMGQDPEQFEYFGDLPISSGQVHDLAYEDRRHLWVVTEGGYLIKINYQRLRVEVFSRIADPDPEDLAYYLAWDQRRGRLGLLRHKPDAENGACRCTLEFYRPVPKMEALTEPVPIEPLRAGQRIPFVWQVTGDAGEGISGCLTKPELVEPATGRLRTAAVVTGRSGEALGEYQAATPATETLQVTAEIKDSG
jgi:hypothetical protein